MQRVLDTAQNVLPQKLLPLLMFTVAIYHRLGGKTIVIQNTIQWRPLIGPWPPFWPPIGPHLLSKRPGSDLLQSLMLILFITPADLTRSLVSRGMAGEA